ncbi:MAG: hypothetical protein L0312_10565 [Acidobacteria bacterium]|nr:hypothetical protein [Acidobacteriota bacterium]
MITDRFRELALFSDAQLELIVRASKGPALDSLVGIEWRGCNTSWRLRAVGLQKFIKGFFQEGMRVEGYNIPVQQNGLDAPWLDQPSPESPKRFAFYLVTQVDRESVDNVYPEALLLDYGASRRNPAYGIERLIRDYLVQPDPTNPDLLLGKAYLAIGTLRLPSNFFVIERLRLSSWRPI